MFIRNHQSIDTNSIYIISAFAHFPSVILHSYHSGGSHKTRTPTRTPHLDTPHRAPNTQHPTPHTPHPTPHTPEHPHRTPYPYPALRTTHPVPRTPYPVPQTPHPVLRISHREPHTALRTHTTQHTPRTAHETPRTQQSAHRTRTRTGHPTPHFTPAPRTHTALHTKPSPIVAIWIRPSYISN